MKLTRWQPFRDIEPWESVREMENRQQEMNRLFDRFAHFGNGDTKLIKSPIIMNEWFKYGENKSFKCLKFN